MSGHQALPGRDVRQPLLLEDAHGDVHAQRGRPVTARAAGPALWPLDEPAPSLALGGIDWAFPSRWPAWLVGDLLLTGTQYERVYDVGSRQSADLFQTSARAAAAARRTGAAPRLSSTSCSRRRRCARTATRREADPGERRHDRRRAPPDLHPYKVPDGTTVGAVSFLGADLALLVRQKTADIDLVGVQRMDASTGALTD